MTYAKAGDTVSIHYTGTLSDGTAFDSSEGRAPLQFTLGEGQVIAGLEAALEGMAVGDSKTVTIAPEDAYGARNEDGVQQVPRAAIPADIPLDPGTRLQVRTPEGNTMVVTVAHVTEAEVTLDANHPLAGKALTFAVEMVEIA